MPYSDTDRRIKQTTESLVVIDSVTTGAGNAAGTSIIDSTLIGGGTDSFLGMSVIIHPGDFLNTDIRAVSGYATLTGEVDVSAAYKDGQVAAGTPYMIVMTGSGGGGPSPPAF